MIQQELSLDGPRGVTLFGVGGAGGNAVARLFRAPETGMRIVCANTDVQALRAVPSANQLQLGSRLTAGLGAGAKPEIGRAAAREALPEIVAALEGTALCFIAAGLGGGTGTGAAPVIARAARDLGILTIGIATRPFAFEGARRARIAAAGIAELQESVDALVVVCNENLLRIAGPDTTFRDALHLSDSIVCESATDFAGLVAGPALKRVTIADIRATLTSGGRTVIGYGERCTGNDRARLAAESALRNPLLEDAPRGAQRLLVTIAGGNDLGLFEVEEAVDYLRNNVHAGVDFVWGSVIDPALEGRMRVGITASGLPPRERIEELALASLARQPAKASVVAARPVESAPPVVIERTPVLVPAVPRDIERAMPVALVEIAQGVDADREVRLEDIVADVRPVIVDRDIPVLAGIYSANPDAVDDRPLSVDRPMAQGPIRSRGTSASLADRIFFATRDLKRNWRRPAVPVELRLPPKARISSGLPQRAAGSVGRGGLS